MRLGRTAALAAVMAALGASTARAATNTISTVAGGGTNGTGDGGPATAAAVSVPVSVTTVSSGGYLIAAQGTASVRRVAPDGTISTVAGNGNAGSTGDGGPATRAELNAPNDAEQLPDGSIVIADSNNNRIRRVAPDGTITTVAGTGAASFSGDGGLANAATLAFPADIAVAADGSYLIADNDNNRIRRVSPDGTITTVAGTGVAGGAGDGGPATSAQISGPSGVAFVPGGGFLIVEGDANRVRRVAADGTISTVAGTGVAGFNGDGIAATQAELNQPTRVAVAADGSFLIADSGNNRVRRVAANGLISTVAGTGVSGFSGDGGPATAAQLARPLGVAIDAGNDYLIADLNNGRIRKVDAGDPTPVPTPSPPPTPTPGTGKPTLAAATPRSTSSSAIALSGTVNPQGLATAVHFEYGLDPQYAGGGPVVYDQATAAQTIGADFSAHAVSATAGSLLPNALYHVRLVAVNSAGATDGPDQLIRTRADPAPPAPVIGKTENAAPVSGVVFIELPGGARAAQFAFTARALVKGKSYIPLTQARRLPIGTKVDARRGTLKLTTAAARVGKTQSATFSGGVFKLASQDRRGLTKGLATVSLLSNDFPGAPSFSSCPQAKASAAGAAHEAKLSSKILQTLSAKDSGGRFRTRGRYSAGTVRGTVWETVERCDGTLTIVRRGAVSVQDFARRRTITIRAGHHYLARAPVPKTRRR